MVPLRIGVEPGPVLGLGITRHGGVAMGAVVVVPVVHAIDLV